ncbi:hypothetical protein D770_13250 [Flammeovirgaceae bacterium 311]|nr:hypothetical protein D770_13250 [Flammeovirgaceae bacterium 311]
MRNASTSCRLIPLKSVEKGMLHQPGSAVSAGADRQGPHNVIPQWLEQAKARQSQWQQYKSVTPGKLLDAANVEKVDVDDVTITSPKKTGNGPSR